MLDDHHSFERRRPERVFGNIVDILTLSRFGEHLEIIGDKREHFWVYPCGDTIAMENDKAASAGRLVVEIRGDSDMKGIEEEDAPVPWCPEVSVPKI